MSGEESEEDEYDRMRRAALYQWFRVAALVGVFLGSSFAAVTAFVLALILDVVIGPSLVYSVSGQEIPLVRAVEAGSFLLILSDLTYIYFNDEPELRNIP